MEKKPKSLDYTIKTLSPVFIGGQTEELLPEMDYLHFQKEKCLAILNPKKLSQILQEQDINAWVSIIDNLQGAKRQSLMDLIRKRKPNIQAQDLALRLIRLKGSFPKENGGRIRAFASSLGQVYLPGSSIKGSLRTLLLNELIEQDPKFVGNKGSLSKGQDFKGNPRFSDEALQAYYLGGLRQDKRMKVQDDPLRLFRMGDAHFEVLPQTILYQNNIFNLSKEDWDFKIHQKAYYECIPQGAIAQGRLHFDERLKKLWTGNKAILKQLEAKRLLGYAKKHTARLVDAEIEFWEGEDNPHKIKDYLDALKSIKNQIYKCQENEAIIRIGAGSGWDFMTGAWAKEDGWVGKTGEIIDLKTWEALKKAVRRGKEYRQGIFPKTRKVLSDNDFEDTEPLGFIKLSIDL